MGNMPKEQKKSEDNMEDEEEGGINLFDYLIVLVKRKKLILMITLTVAILSITISLFSSISFYMAQTSILPPQREQLNMANRFFSEYGIFPGMQGNITSKQELLVEIIKSRTFTDKVIERFNLKRLYDAKDIEEARKMLLQNIIIEPDFTDEKAFNIRRSSQSPLMKITAIDQSPEKAADMANAIVEELKLFVNNIAISEASQRRLFFEEHLKQASDALFKSEEDIKIFQQKTGLLAIDTQTRMTIERIATLQAQIAAKEIELQMMESYTAASNPDFQRVKETIRVLKKELAKLDLSKNNSRDLLIPTGTILSLGMDYNRILRQLKFNEALYEIMVKQFEAAKIDESKDSSLIQVIDKAVPPEMPTKMRTWGGKKAFGVIVFAFFFSCFLAFVMEYHERSSKNKEHKERVEILMRYLSFKKNK